MALMETTRMSRNKKNSLFDPYLSPNQTGPFTAMFEESINSWLCIHLCQYKHSLTPGFYRHLRTELVTSTAE